MEYLTNYWAVSLHFFAMILIYQKNAIGAKTFIIGAGGGEM
jgi:hypothetical protein